MTWAMKEMKQVQQAHVHLWIIGLFTDLIYRRKNDTSVVMLYVAFTTSHFLASW